MNKAKFIRRSICYLDVDIISYEQIIKKIEYYIEMNYKRRVIIAINPEKIINSTKDDQLKKFINGSDILIPDGIGIVIALYLLYGIRTKRITGVDLFHRIIRISKDKKYRIFIYGSKEYINKIAVRRIEERVPGIQIVGKSHGYVADYEMPKLIDKINQSKANILFIGLGSPRQEKWIARYIDCLDVNVCMGIGGTLDTIAYNKLRSPVMIRRLGFEWLWRLIMEPSRIRRQIKLLYFLVLLAKCNLK